MFFVVIARLRFIILGIFLDEWSYYKHAFELCEGNELIKLWPHRTIYCGEINIDALFFNHCQDIFFVGKYLRGPGQRTGQHFGFL